ncbi:MAG: hypothetical protein A2148_07300 [Chloroflexi bacterium RBG_16_68_14]|nr:MAG: hypothetical protein A2148_07300 [Chloroflexi bacterium RBG_16_68_14]
MIAEALGGDYTEGGRVSAATGLPTLLQWPGHQLQWRGTSDPQTGRTEDLELLYTSSDPEAVKAVIQKYNLTYVFLGNIERQTYPDLRLPEMGDLLEPAFEQGETIIYRVRPGVRSGVTLE